MHVMESLSVEDYASSAAAPLATAIPYVSDSEEEVLVEEESDDEEFEEPYRVQAEKILEEYGSNWKVNKKLDRLDANLITTVFLQAKKRPYIPPGFVMRDDVLYKWLKNIKN